ncbi:DUF7263 family protein [Haloarchaeobius amylolyticus]|uniref:DUF7263 family protein n=1 Tax=Haloarchaeobius amylolyticus TaxID=1198296 RepID=UPI0022714D14|nr:hypothetical protein [Haloarchaeobius amylolyticus]
MNPDRDRGQANLVALGIALLALTAVLGVALVVADSALSGADRDPAERRVAVSLSDRLVAADGPVTARANVLDAAAVGSLDATALASQFPVGDGHDVRVRLGDRTIAESGDVTDGTSVRRIVLVERETTATLTPDLTADGAVTLPRRTDRVDVRLAPPSGTTVTTVRANGRVVLHDPGGLRGSVTVPVSRFETTTLSFDAAGTLPPGSVDLTYYPTRTTKAVLVVTVDA